jgi:sugar phosphate isomerase/epimerase
MTDFTLAVNLCFVRKRWTDPADWARLVRVELGLERAEFCSDLLDPLLVSEPARTRLAHETRDAFAEAGVTINDYYTGVITHCLNLLSHPEEALRADAMRWCMGAVDLALELGTRIVGGHFDTIPVADWSNPPRNAAAVDRLIDSMQAFARYGAARGLEALLWEQMYTPNEVPHTLEEARTLHARVNAGAAIPVHLTLDVGHACNLHYSHDEHDLDPYAWLEAFADVSPVIHLQQTDGRASHHWPFTEACNARGIIVAERVLEAIERSGSAANVLTFEIFHSLGQTEQTVLDDHKRSVEYWRRALDRW